MQNKMIDLSHRLRPAFIVFFLFMKLNGNTTDSRGSYFIL